MRAPSIWLPILATAATVGSGVIAGLLFVFSNVVMRALGDLPPASGMLAMQRINVIIVNPLFLLFFLGTAAASVAVVAFTCVAPAAPGQGWLLAGSLCYLVGVVGVTMAFNVPLNNGLEAATAAAADTAWPAYATAWLRWNHVRAALGVAATAAFAWGLFRYGSQSS